MSNSSIDKVDISFLNGQTLYDIATFNSGELLFASKETILGKTTHKLIKKNDNTILWEYTLTEVTNQGYLSEVNANGDVIYYGSKYVGQHNYNPYLICIDKDGNYKWDKEFKGNGYDLLSNVQVPNAKFTYITITTESSNLEGSSNYNSNAVLNDRNSNDDNDILIVKISMSNGDILERYRIGSNKYDQVNQVKSINSGITLKGSTYGGNQVLNNNINSYSWDNSNSYNEFIVNIDHTGKTNSTQDYQAISLDEKLDLGFISSQFNIIDNSGVIRYGFVRYINESGSNKNTNTLAFITAEESKEGSLYFSSQPISKLISPNGLSEITAYTYENIYSSERILDLVGTDFEMKGGPDNMGDNKIAYNKNGDLFILGESLSGETILLKSANFFDNLGGNSKNTTTKNFSGNFRDYKLYKRTNEKYEIKNQSGFDEITGITTLNFSNKTINLIDDVKGVFDQVTGLNTDSGKMFRLYNAAFARFPDADGLRYWIGNFSSGVDDERAVSTSFLASSEFKERYGSNISHEKYVETLYLNVLNRELDQGGYDYWVGNLNNGVEQRHEVLLGFSESTENQLLFTDMTGFG